MFIEDFEGKCLSTEKEDRRIILKRIFERLDCVLWSELILLETDCWRAIVNMIIKLRWKWTCDLVRGMFMEDFEGKCLSTEKEDRRIILKWIFERWDCVLWSELILLETDCWRAIVNMIIRLRFRKAVT
jgi:hypothetical protein